MSPPALSVVIVSYNTREDLRACLRALDAASAARPQVIVVDNASADGSAAAAREAWAGAELVENPDNAGFSRACNQGLARAQAPLVLFLNSDCEAAPGALDVLAGALEARPDAVAAGPLTRNPDGTPQLSFGPVLTPWSEWRQRRLVRGVRRRDPAVLAEVEALVGRPAEPAWLSGSCLLARRPALQEVGGFDEGFFLYEEDVDLCLRLRARGGRLLHVPGARVTHHLGRSMAKAPAARVRLEYHRSHLRLYGKHNGPLDRLLLRAWMAASAAAGLLRAEPSGPGEPSVPAALLRLALRGR